MTTPFPATVRKLGLYPVVDNIHWITCLLDAGVRTLQLRIKDRCETEIEATVSAAITLGKRFQARLFINDYWQLAIRHQAYGIHLGQEDLDSADLNMIRRSGLRLGISTHDDTELDRALALHPSYIAVGHIFPTETKKMSSAPQGINGLKRHMTRLNHIPVVAIGGITIERAPAVLDCGVGSIAVVSAITQASNWHLATQTLLALTDRAGVQQYAE